MPYLMNPTYQRPTPIRICDKSEKDFLMAVEEFHGSLTPGLVLGGVMVDLGIELIESCSDLGAVVESACYLPDAVQLFTPCTVGNGQLTIRDWGKMAICLFDRKRHAGYRIWLDLRKTREVSSIYNWSMRLVPKRKRTADPVIQDILTAGRSVLSWRAVPITQQIPDTPAHVPIAVCPKCDEAYPETQGDICISCQGGSYYGITG